VIILRIKERAYPVKEYLAQGLWGATLEETLLGWHITCNT